MFGGGCFFISFTRRETLKVSQWETDQKENLCFWQDLKRYIGSSKRQGGQHPIIFVHQHLYMFPTFLNAEIPNSFEYSILASTLQMQTRAYIKEYRF